MQKRKLRKGGQGVSAIERGVRRPVPESLSSWHEEARL
jgi:hypothetical protein